MGGVALTAFGVVIGTMAVMVLVSLGAGLQRSATGSLDMASLKRIEVTGAMMGEMIEPVAPSGKSSSGPSKKPPALTNTALDELRTIPGVAEVIPLEEAQGVRLLYKKNEGWGQVISSGPKTLEQLGLKAEIGSTELGHGQMIVGAGLPRELLGPPARADQGQDIVGRAAYSGGDAIIGRRRDDDTGLALRGGRRVGRGRR